MDMLQDPQYKTPDGAALRIWKDAAPNKFQSEQHGIPLFDEVIYVEVITPGSRDSTPVFELKRVFCAEMNHPQPLYGQKYEELKQYVLDFERDDKITSSLAGTPLVQWPELTRTLIATLKAQGVFTVDALAELPDQKLHVVGPDGRSWREKAKAYIENAKGGAYATELAGRVTALETALAAGQAREKELSDLVAKLQSDASMGTKSAKAKNTVESAVVEPIVQTQQPSSAVAAEGEVLITAEATKAVATSQPII